MPSSKYNAIKEAIRKKTEDGDTEALSLLDPDVVKEKDASWVSDVCECVRAQSNV